MFVIVETKMNIENFEKENNYTYSVRSFLSGCRFWNESSDSWESGGCEVMQLIL